MTAARAPGFLGRTVLLEREVCWFLVLSAADLFLTHALLRRGVHFYESNPLANWSLRAFNVPGLVGFKFGIIAGVVVLCEVIERSRPGWGRKVLWVGIVAVGGVVLYSLSLWFRHA